MPRKTAPYGYCTNPECVGKNALTETSAPGVVWCAICSQETDLASVNRGLADYEAGRGTLVDETGLRAELAEQPNASRPELGYPDPASEPAELAEWWTAHGAALNSRLWAIKRRVEDYVRDRTVVDTAHGTLEAQSAGWEWDEDAVATTAPECLSSVSVTFTGTQAEVERALSLVTEEIPGMDFTVARSIDKRRAGKFANAGGELGERVAACRTAKPAKVVIR